ncbi:hypothetical protein [Synechococcus sp. UW105]|uniref:hypothetical protein n=1 Tax=Synechococcus sp. UW105 TaxID=337067 RepID=UPI000E0FE509|nr:hypothetical protein [Synechococcus sp. UW105]
MSWFSELDRLQPLVDDLAFLPVGWGNEGKGPMLNGWQKHAGFSVDQLQTADGMRSVGARTGLLTGPLLCFDFDGETALGLGIYPWEATTWQVHRDNDPFRLKVLCRPTPEQLEMLPQQLDGTVEFQGKTITAPKQDDAKGEALEVFFFGGRQVIVLGEHPSSGGNYFWPAGLGPEALNAPPDDWWAHAVSIALKQTALAASGSRPSKTRNGTRRLDPCPICGRHSGRGGSALWCDETSDGLILCMPGSTFSAEQSHGPLSIGQVVNGYALVKRTGDVLTFKPHQPLPCRRKRNARNQHLARLAVTAS